MLKTFKNVPCKKDSLFHFCKCHQKVASNYQLRNYNNINFSNMKTIVSSQQETKSTPKYISSLYWLLFKKFGFVEGSQSKLNLFISLRRATVVEEKCSFWERDSTILQVAPVVASTFY